MTTNKDMMARTAVQLTRAAPLFDHLVNVLLPQRPDASAGSPTPEGARQDPTAAELSAVRERLDGYFPEFSQLYLTLLRQHVGPDLPAVLAALSNELVQTYFRAVAAMESELIAALQKLGEKMARETPVGSAPPGVAA